MTDTFQDKLINIQQDLKAEKKRYSEYGDYHYRNAEDIIDAVKPLLKKHNLRLGGKSKILHLGDRYYIEYEAFITDGKNIESSTGLSREDLDRKKMQPEQLTASSNSYAKKMALESLFGLDETKSKEIIEDNNENLNKIINYAKSKNLTLEQTIEKLKKQNKDLSSSLLNKIEEAFKNENS